MRIIKLSEEEFSDLQDVQEFFRDDLPHREPRGKFRITPGRIAKDGLQSDEQLLFSYKGVIYYVALSATGRLDNDDECQDEYPYYFQIDMDTLRSIEIDLAEIEARYHRETNETKSLVQTQGWPKIENLIFVKSLWDFLT